MFYSKHKIIKKMKNIYATIDNEHAAVLFSKKMVKKYLQLYPDAQFQTFSNIQTAVQRAKPEDYNSEKVFAIKTGRIAGCYFSNTEFLNLMRGVKNNEGKKCRNIKQAYRYIYSTDIPKNLYMPTVKDSDFDEVEPITAVINKSNDKDNNNTVAYVDGSFFPDSNLMGIAYAIQGPTLNCSHSSFIQLKEEGSNTKAELMSAMMAIDRAIKDGLKEITIIYDNQAISSIPQSEKQKNSFNKEYYNFIKDASKNISIEFKKVKAHSGDKGNTFVDKLAKHSNIDKFLKML